MCHLQGGHSLLPSDQVDLRTFPTDNKFANERRCLQLVRQVLEKQGYRIGQEIDRTGRPSGRPDSKL